MQTFMKVRLVHSPAGRVPKQRETVKGLGLSRLYGERIIEDTPCTRGMVQRIPHLVKIVAHGLRAPKA